MVAAKPRMSRNCRQNPRGGGAGQSLSAAIRPRNRTARDNPDALCIGIFYIGCRGSAVGGGPTAIYSPGGLLILTRCRLTTCNTERKFNDLTIPAISVLHSHR